jgi:hypothetical protein
VPGKPLGSLQRQSDDRDRERGIRDMTTEEKVYRVARIVAHLVGQGQGWNQAVAEVARNLGVSEKAIWHCVNETRFALSDPYLESLG